MKKIVFYILFASLLVACNKDSEISADTTQNTETSAVSVSSYMKQS